jgi:hypothetical protein
MEPAKRSRATGNLALKTLAVGPGLNIGNAVMAGLGPDIHAALPALTSPSSEASDEAAVFSGNGRVKPVMTENHTQRHKSSATYCGKSETRLSWRYEPSFAFWMPKRPLAPWRFCRGKGRENFSLAKNARNPLISLDSNERIQGNPRKSNAYNPGFRSETARLQDNPNAPRFTRT